MSKIRMTLKRFCSMLIDSQVVEVITQSGAYATNAHSIATCELYNSEQYYVHHAYALENTIYVFLEQ